jgi:hypothetical protein
MMKRKPVSASARSPVRSRQRADEARRLSHLRREVKTALELAIAALARADIVDGLATAAGLLDALDEFPRSSAPVLALLPRASERALQSLQAWRDWQARPSRKPSA